jgi:uncharacterized protein (DUF2147 family)
MKTRYILILILTVYLLPLKAVDPNDIVGKWLSPENKAIIEVEYTAGKYTAKILRVNPLGYINGAVPKDIYNSEPSLRLRSLEGITILSGISFDLSKKRWNIESIYEPERGKYFEGYIVLENRAMLSLRGHVPGKKWLGKTEKWIRIEGVSPF